MFTNACEKDSLDAASGYNMKRERERLIERDYRENYETIFLISQL